jgi:NAD(P)-dependent dehydrogenase (short-subunit alcohol dehydrogenase family)
MYGKPSQSFSRRESAFSIKLATHPTNSNDKRRYQRNMTISDGRVWLVTGANSGLGLSITLAALSAGRRVIATARDVTKAAAENPKVEHNGGRWLSLDVRDSTTSKKVEDAIRSEGGTLECVVNNAGIGFVGAMEDFT